MQEQPGRLVLFGSGETSASGQKVFDWLFQRAPGPIRIAILETPAGFEPNSALVAGRIAEFLRQRLQNYPLEIAVVPARKRGTAFSPDDPALAEPVLGADCIFLGPGSPTYAVRQLRDSLLWDAARQRFLDGGTLVLASAAVLAVSAFTLPVYEIYKAGAELGWERGLDLLGPAGGRLVFIPHWNNHDGGAELDTSHCFMGAERFARLRALLPEPVTLVGIDERTACVLEPASATVHVLGQGGVTLERAGHSRRYERGSTFGLDLLGNFDWGALARTLPPERRAWAREAAARLARPAEPPPAVPSDVLALVEQREAARQRRDWATADALRAEVARLGFLVQDTPSGPQVQPRPA